MKAAIATVCISFTAILSTSVLAADVHTGHGAMPGASPVVAAMADGVVKKVDKSGGKLTLAHGPLTNLGMPPMTMVFRVKDAAWLDQLKDGDKIRFIAENLNGALTVVKVDKAK